MSIQPEHWAEDDALLNIHGILDRSRANGPGIRTAIWFQGCNLGCPGCFNPGTHSKEPKHLVRVSELLTRLRIREREIEGVSITGGEPLQQEAGLLSLLRGIRMTTSLSVVLFSGYCEDEICRMPEGNRVLQLIDLLVSGRYVARLHLGRGLLGSTNQKLRFLTPRYCLQDLVCVPCAEIFVDSRGNMSISGISPPQIG